MMSELSLSKIQTPTDAKLLCNFADGSRAKIFLPLNPSNFCPLAERILQKFLCRFLILKILRITFRAYLKSSFAGFGQSAKGTKSDTLCYTHP
jgi:hypothetical protein